MNYKQAFTKVVCSIIPLLYLQYGFFNEGFQRVSRGRLGGFHLCKQVEYTCTRTVAKCELDIGQTLWWPNGSIN